MRRVWLGLGLFGLIGCPKGGGGSSLTAMDFAKPAATIDYDRHTVAGPFPLPVLQHREEWQPPIVQGDNTLYDVKTYDTTDGNHDWMETVRVFYGPAGYGFFGTVDEDGDVERWEPAQVVLPANPAIGDTWTATHTKGNRSSERSCEIMPASHCAGGIVSVCESRREIGVVVLRDHFCPAQGWVGFEALQSVGAQPPLRMWSETIARDGVPIPGIPVEEDE